GALPVTAVPFADLKAHVSALRGEIDEAVARVLDSGWFILGPEVEAFERELARALDASDAVAVGNGTEAIQLALEALGVRAGDEGRRVGALSGIGALSFYPTKNLGALGDGGAVLVNDPEVAQRVRRLRNGGQSDRYRHEVSGINSRLDEVQAAILRAKLRHLDDWTERRRALAARYRDGLSGVGLGLPQEQTYARAVHHLYVVRQPRAEARA